MSKAVLLSLNSQWVMPIFETHEKIYEVRKRAPKLEHPYDVYVYCTIREPKIERSGETLNGFVIGKFTCTNTIKMNSPWKGKSAGTCLTDRQLAEYSNLEHLMFMEISNPVWFDNPFRLSDINIMHVPQSWQYIEV